MKLLAIAVVALFVSTAGGYAADRDKPLKNTGASTRPDSRKYRSFDYAEPTKKVKMRLTMPERLTVVRGILVVAPFSGGDTRDFYREVWFHEFMDQHGFAFLGAECSNSHAEQFKVMQNALKKIAGDTDHPELVHVPYVATGFSAGGGFASRLLVEVPDKVIAAAIVGSRPNFAGTASSDSLLGIPVLIINGEDEGNGMAAAVEPVLKSYRPKGALFGWMAVQGIGHERDCQEVLAMPMLDAAVRFRYPADGDVRKGPVTLKPIAPESGWIADNTTWRNGLTAIAAAKVFKGEPAKSSWLLNEDIAFVYRAYSTFDRPLKITSPTNTTDNSRELVWDAGSSVTFTVDDSRFAGWTKLELYDGATKVGERLKGPAEFIVKDLKPGFHPFSVLGTDNKGKARPSGPVLVVVRKQ